MDGGWAMGVGHALLEELPADASGAANGKWNLNRYHVALSADCAIHDVEKILIPPDSEDPSPRGIAELVLTPVPVSDLQCRHARHWPPVPVVADNA